MVRIRKAQLSDADTVYNLMAAQYLFDIGYVPRSRQAFQAIWEAFDFKNILVLETDADELLAYCQLDHDAAEKTFAWFFWKQEDEANPSYAEFLAALEAKTAQDGAKFLSFRIMKNHPVMMDLLREKDYENYLSFLIMEIVMQESPDLPIWAEGITVRQFEQGKDDEATYRMDEGASKDKGYYNALSYEAWRKRMGMEKESFDPSLWLLACAGEEIVAGALNSLDSEMEKGWIDHLGVSRDWRRKGIGMALLKYSFRAFYERGIKAVGLSVDSQSKTNAHHLYEKAGMQIVDSFHYFRKAL